MKNRLQALSLLDRALLAMTDAELETLVASLPDDHRDAIDSLCGAREGGFEDPASRTLAIRASAARGRMSGVLEQLATVLTDPCLAECITALGDASDSPSEEQLQAVVPGLVDVAPELQPFDRGTELSRVLVRTKRDWPLSDLLDASLGALGHVGLLWDAVAKHGHGVLMPQVLVRTQDGPPAPAEPMAMKGLLLRFGAPFAERIALYAGIQRDKAISAPPPPPMTVEAKIAIADELGGKRLAKLAVKKLVKRYGG
jgi:hypothetical protein